ncbi:MAG: MFS transporter [Candidatus Omnitrophica bacterium]|nr:MFS transporter [Candidatus Omnitrophota bacterium]
MAQVARQHPSNLLTIISSRPHAALLAWASFDLANTFFAVAMITFYFPLWLIEDRGVPELLFSVALSGSMIGVALLMPICGAMADATGQRMRYLRWTSLVCIGLTFLLGWVDHVGLALGLFALANAAYQLGTVFYDALLRQVALKGRLGQASGFGSAFGYLGSMVGLSFLWPFVQSAGYHAAVIPSAIYFLLFALPSFLLIRDPAPTSSVLPRKTAREAIRQLGKTLRQSRTIPGVWWFFLASFLSLNAINTILIFMAIYTKRVLGFSDSEMIRFFLVGQGSAVLGALAGARVIDRLGAHRTLGFIWLGWTVALALAAWLVNPAWLWVIGPVIGCCLGPTWATSRVLLIQLCPKHQTAEFLGLAGLLSRVSSIIGPLIWGVIVLDPTQYRQAVWVLVGLMVMGVAVLQKVPKTKEVAG